MITMSENRNAKPREMPHDIMTVAQVAEKLGVTTRSVQNMLNDGKLDGFKLPTATGDWLVYRESVEASQKSIR